MANELDLVLSKALNISCQKSKRAKFRSESSEDAVTWTVFRYLSDIRGLSILAEAVNAQADPVASPAMLLWGAPSCRSSKEYEILSELITQLDFLGEDSKRRTEPDVIVAWPNLLIIVEAKYLGGNVRQTNYQHLDRYLGDDSEFFNTPSVDIKRAGYYELVRNWRVGVGLADERNFIFVNLGIPKFISRDCSVFAKQVRQSERRRFAELSWRDLLTRIKYPALWFQKFVQDKGLI